MESKELVTIIEESGLEKTQGQVILDNFSTFIKEASEWETKAKSIIITDVSQVEEMQTAREARLALKGIRVNAENTRKALKEKSIREGKAIDGIANVIKALIVPLEEHLEAQEKFAENIEKDRLQKLETERASELMKYTDDITLYNYKEMSDEVFAKLVSTLKMSWEADQAALKKAEEDRIAKEKEEKAEQERTRIERDKLKKEAEEREKAIAEEKAEAEKKRQAERAEEEKKLAAEKAKREALEKEIREKKEAEEREKKEVERKAEQERLAKLEAEKQEALKPEKEKLNAFADSIKNIVSPVDLSVAGRAIVEEAEKKLLAISQEIKIKIKNL